MSDKYFRLICKKLSKITPLSRQDYSMLLSEYKEDLSPSKLYKLGLDFASIHSLSGQRGNQ